LQQVSKNLSALNAVYELQLQGSSEHLKATNKMYEGIESLYRNLQDSVQDTNKYKEEIGKLATNLGALNTVYGNMLSAMNFNR
jgi:gliding motility-associated protein GldL